MKIHSKQAGLPIGIVLWGLLLAIPTALAQFDPEQTVIAMVDDAAQKKMDALKQSRRNLIIANLTLTEDESNRFWPLYSQYEQALTLLYAKRNAIFEELGENYDDLTDKEAQHFVEQHWDYYQERAHLSGEFFKRFAKVLPGRKLARFYQIETHIRTAIDAEIARRIPLVQ